MKGYYNFELLLKSLDVETVYMLGSFTSTYQDSYADVQNPPAEVLSAGTMFAHNKLHAYEVSVIN